MTTEVTSTRNARVRAAAALARRRERVATGRHLVEGPRAVAEALAAGVVVELFVTTAGHQRLAAGVIGAGTAADVPVVAVADHVLAYLADATTPQGVVAVARTPETGLAAIDPGGLVVVLDGVADPGNVGAIVRTADAAGARAVVVTAGAADPFGPKAVRAAVGSTYHLPVVTDVTLEQVATACRDGGRRVLGLDAAGPRSVFDLDASDLPLALVLGSEAHGLSAPDLLDATLAVPIAGRAESLNVAAGAAVAIFAAANTPGR